MQNILLKITSASTLALLILLFWLWNQNKSILSQVSDYELLLNTQKQASVSWKDQAGYWRNQSQVLVLQSEKSLKMLSKNSEEFINLKNEFSALKSNLRNLSLYAKTGLQSDYKLHIPLQDTVLTQADSSLKPVKKLHFRSKWITVDGFVIGDSLLPNIQTRDSLVTVVYWKRKWFLGKKHYVQEIKSFNPHTQIKFNQTVMVRKLK